MSCDHSDATIRRLTAELKAAREELAELPFLRAELSLLREEIAEVIHKAEKAQRRIEKALTRARREEGKEV